MRYCGVEILYTDGQTLVTACHGVAVETECVRLVIKEENKTSSTKIPIDTIKEITIKISQ